MSRGRRRRQAMRRAQTALLVVALLGAGVLLGSFWIEWRHTRLAEVPAELEGTPRSFGEMETVRVEVLNGSGEPGAARRVAEWLRAAGFDVVFYGNAESFGRPATSVLDRSGRAGAAGAVAESLGVAGAASDPRPDLYLDATVLLGADWRALVAARDSARRAAGAEPRRRPF